MHTNTVNHAIISVIFFVFLSSSSTTFAQANAGEVNDSLIIEEVVVTAQKRTQNLQDVPIAVSVISGADLDVKQIINMEDIRNLVPNLYMEQALAGTTTPKMFLRGLGVDNQVYSFDSPIGLYFDGVYIARVTGALIDLFDVERIEFLRGPQGTLFGRNSSVGALSIVNNNPPLDKTETSAELSYGTRDQLNARFAFGAPIIEDKLGLRVTFLSRSNDGFMVDTTTNVRHMDNDINAARVALLYKVNDNVDLTLRGDGMIDHSMPTQGSNFRINPDNDIYTFESSPGTPFVNEVEPWGVSATINARLASADLTSITAYRELRYRNANDVDGRADVQSFQVDQQDLDEWQFTQEVFLSSNSPGGSRFNWTAGAFYLHEQNDFRWALRIFAPPTTQIYDQTTNSVAGYTQVTYDVTARLKVTGGLRYTYEKKALTAIQNFADGTPNPDFVFDDSITANKASWHLSTDYRINDDAMIYITSGTAFRSGGFDGSARNIPAILSGAFGPEDVFNIEGGAKTEWFDRRMQLNLGYFYSDYDGVQQAIVLSDGTITTTGADATVHGVEAELVALPIEGLQLTANLGTMKDDIKNSNRVLKNTPAIQWRVGAIYSMPIGDGGGSLRIGGDVSHSASYFNSTGNEINSKVEPYELYNAHIAYLTESGHWQFKFSGQNLGDHFFPAHTFDIAGGFISSVHFPNTPRRYLFTVSYLY